MRHWARLEEAVLSQRGAYFLWAPVCLSLGIGIYFSLGTEPDATLVAIAVALSAAAGVLVRFGPAILQPFVMGLALVVCGIGLAKWQTEDLRAPILEFRYYGPIEGRIVGIDRSASDAVRLTLDQVRLDRMSPARTPPRVRLSLHGDQPLSDWQPGTVVMTTGHLSPPGGPAEPGGFDFQRHAYFNGLGAVGYTRNPMLRAAPAEGGAALAVFRLRMALSQGIRDAMPGETGAFAAAILSGDRSGMGQDTLADLRAANLAHLLAISGLHMGLLTGFIFVAVRTGLALVPGLALRLKTKKIAALVALAVGAFYLLLSGGNVATERAFIMVAVMLVAVLMDRRALTLRAVALAAVIVLVLSPEALLSPGFQMSFAATTALVAVFGVLRHVDMRWMPKWARGAFSVFVSSFVAGAATAPIAAAHFNQIAHFGLIANLSSVPVMGMLVMPAAVLAACLWPLGLSWIGLWLMHQGLRWILFVAHGVAGWDGAVGHVPAPDMRLVALLSLGALMLILWRGHARWLGAPAIAASLLLWWQVDRPTLLIAESGGLMGVMTDAGRSLSKPRGDGFVAGIWLENDGGPVPQDEAALRGGFDRQGRVFRAQVGRHEVLQVSGKTALAGLDGCGGAAILIVNVEDVVDRPCLRLDPVLLRGTGALAISEKEGGLAFRSARDITGIRPWNAHNDPPDANGLQLAPQAATALAENQ